MKYRKKPVVIEAIRWNGIGFQVGEMPQWFLDAYMSKQINRKDDTLIITTLEGDMTANPKDFIIQGVKGEIYPCKPDIFEATYERVE